MNRKLIALPLLLLFAFPLNRAQAQTTAAPCTPGISFWKLLDSVNIGYGDGRLSIEKLYAVCLPTPAKPSTTNYPYDPDSGGKLTTRVKSADGTLLNTYVWYAESIGGLWELSSYKVLGGYETVKPLATGKYLLEFAADDKPFTRFPFSVVAIKSDDPYKPAGMRYFIEGAWNDYGNIYYQRNDPQSSLQFTTWIQDKRGNQNETAVPYDVKLVRLKDGKVLGEEAGTFRMDPHWLKAQLNFHSPGDKNAYLKGGDLIAEDGRYVVRLTIDGKLYGEYPLTVAGGKVQLQGKQIRNNTDPMDYIVDYMGGGRYTSWWLKRENGSR